MTPNVMILKKAFDGIGDQGVGLRTLLFSISLKRAIFDFVKSLMAIDPDELLPPRA